MFLILCLDTINRKLGASGIGELIANTLAVRNVTVVVLDIKPIVTENCEAYYNNLVSSAYAESLWVRQYRIL